MYEHAQNGIFCLKKVGKNMTEIVEQISNVPIRIVARLRDIDQNGYGILFEWSDSDSQLRNYACWLNEAWHSRGGVYEELVREIGGGFFSASEFIKFVQHYNSLALAGEIPTINSSNKSGWGPGYQYFVANGFKFGEKCPVYMSKRGIRWDRSGDEKAFFKQYAKVLNENPAIAFISGFFAAGSLVKLVKAENFMLSIVGRTSTGKTLAIKTALAMRGNPQDFATFDSTSGALKSLLKQAGDSCLTIDEIGQSGLNSEQKQKILYDFSQGKERGRLSKVGQDFGARDPDRIFYTSIFTGEESINSNSHAGGAQVRVTELIFDDNNKLWNSIDSAAKAEEWERFISENYGHLMPKLIEYIANNSHDVAGLYYDTLESLRNHAESISVISDSAGARKMKTFALAQVGATIIAEILENADIFDAVNEFVYQKIGEGVATAAASDNDKFAEFLESIPTKYADRLYGGSHDNIRSPVGEMSRRDERINLKILASELKTLVARENIDEKRFLEWSAQAGSLKFISNGGGKRAFRKRIKIAGNYSPAYEFEFSNCAEHNSM